MLSRVENVSLYGFYPTILRQRNRVHGNIKTRRQRGAPARGRVLAFERAAVSVFLSAGDLGGRSNVVYELQRQTRHSRRHG